MNAPHIELKSFVVGENQKPVRIDKFLTNQLEDLSRSYIQILIQNHNVLVDGEPVKPSEKIAPGATIEVKLVKRPKLEIHAEDIPLNVVYEDDALIVINKPAGMVVHPGCANFSGTLVNALMHHYNALSSLSGEDRPGIVHRLDKDTSGLMVVAKNDIVHAALAKQFAEKTAGRIYHAIIWGIPKNTTQRIESFLTRDKKDRKKMMISEADGKWAATNMQVLERFEKFASLAEFKLETGRTHQIRVHAASIGHPVFGDLTYGGRRQRMSGMRKDRAKFTAELLGDFKRQALHAKTLRFFHPVEKKLMEFDSEIPDDMQHIMREIHGFCMAL